MTAGAQPVIERNELTCATEAAYKVICAVRMLHTTIAGSAAVVRRDGCGRDAAASAFASQRER
jgi:hypothetical protein